MSNAASKKTLIIMVAVFVLPVVLAKLALDNDWFTKGATNKGQLLAPTIDMSALLENAEPKWRLLYVMPSKCDAVCENAHGFVAKPRAGTTHRIPCTKQRLRAQTFTLYSSPYHA